MCGLLESIRKPDAGRLLITAGSRKQRKPEALEAGSRAAADHGWKPEATEAGSTGSRKPGGC